jgi:sugar O-acyltransferase (sialic acid O-acetyltransferase NeuD family)
MFTSRRFYEKVILWGGTGQAKVIRPILESEGHEIVAVFDETPNLRPPFNNIPLHYGWDAFEQWVNHRMEETLGFCVTIGNPHGRVRLQFHNHLMKAGLEPVDAIHPQAIIAHNASIKEGVQILAGAIVAPEAVVGRQCIINHHACLDHESILEDGGELAPGAVVCGQVHMGMNVWVGAGATVLPRLVIGDDVIIAAGAVVTKDVPPGATVVGIPARIIKLAGDQ